MKKIKFKPILIIIIVLCLIIPSSYLMLHTPEVTPNKWNALKSEGYTGPFSKNNKLAQLSFLNISPYVNPETVIFYDNWLYASVDDGIIIRFREDGSSLSEIVNTGGSIIGFAFDSIGNIIFTDASYDHDGGAICIAYKEKDYQIDTLVTEYKGEHLMFPDALTIDSNDNIYFTDACKINTSHHSNNTTFTSNIDHIAHTKTGKLYVYNAKTHKTEFIAGGFSFANGILLSPDCTSIFLNETSEYRIWKINLKIREAQAGDTGTEVIIDNLPGYPDNLSYGSNGEIWVGLVSPRSELLDSISDKTFLRKVLLNLPDKLLARIMNGENYSHIFSMTEFGEVISNLQATSIKYTNITGVCDTSARLYLSNICGQEQIAYLNKEHPI